MKLGRLIRMSLALAILTMAGLVISFLALTDINHGLEPNLVTEWGVVRVTWFITVLFTIMASVTIVRLSNSRNRAEG